MSSQAICFIGESGPVGAGACTGTPRPLPTPAPAHNLKWCKMGAGSEVPRLRTRTRRPTLNKKTGKHGIVQNTYVLLLKVERVAMAPRREPSDHHQPLHLRTTLHRTESRGPGRDGTGSSTTSYLGRRNFIVKTML